MATKEAHLDQAKKNLRFLEECGSCFSIIDSYLEWYLTVKFYAALHVIDAVFAIKTIHPQNHDYRLKSVFLLKKEFGLSVANRYRDLYNTSIKARYLEHNGGNVLKGDLQDFEVGYQTIIDFAKQKHNILLN